MSHYLKEYTGRCTPQDCSHRTVSSEDPWDGGGHSYPRVQAKPLDTPFKAGFLLLLGSLLTLLILLLAGTVKGESAEVSSGSEKNSKTEFKIRIDKETLELAEEYAYLLEQLVLLSTDYCGYFEKLDTKEAKENYKALYGLCTKLSKEGYYDDVGKLVKEITELKTELAKRERELTKLQHELRRGSADLQSAQGSLKALQLTSSYRDELEALEEQLEEEVASQTYANQARREVIQKYVRQLVKDSVLLLGRGTATVAIPQISIATILNDSGTTTFIIDVNDEPNNEKGYVTVAPEPPELPEPEISKPHTTGSESPAYSYGYAASTLEDSLDVGSEETRLYVINPIGELKISGWSRRKVKANFNVTVKSALPEKALRLSSRVQLRMYLKQDNIYIESVVPDVTDPKTRISDSKLELIVPYENELFVNNSSGDILAAGIHNGISIKSSNSHIELNRIDGNVKIVNSSGPVSLERVDGTMIVQNRMGPVTLQNCNGTIELDISFGGAVIDRCKGDAVVRNTGTARISAHTGNVELSNRNGRVEIDRIDGDLTVFNSFEPVFVSSVTGSVRLENANAPVEAVGIGGHLNISNRFGQIRASLVGGPINIENRNGDVIIQLEQMLLGNSEVVTSGGQVFLAVSPRNNLLLTMESRGGEIDISDFDSKVSTIEPGVNIAELAIGRGVNMLAVKGNNSRIVVSETH